MISFIKGTLESVEEQSIIIEASGIGYQIFTTTQVVQSALSKLQQEMKIFTFLQAREDAMVLYGFDKKETLSLFKQLINVSGVGPKYALGVLSVLAPQDVVYAIANEDIKTLCKAPGIGKKTAQRIILDLKDKVSIAPIMDLGFDEKGQLNPLANSVREEAIEALVALGYGRIEVVGIVNKINCDKLKTEDVVKKALKALMKF